MNDEGRRSPDLGNGTYLNPILGGDHPDPTILKDGQDYYMTFSSMLAVPGLVVWHSKDLVNWRPICTALNRSIGTVWAPDLIKHGDRYFIYIPVVSGANPSTHVLWADHIEGPWSDPIDLKVYDCIDPGHAVGEDGKRYLFFNGVRRIALADDGLSTVGDLENVYEPWRYPDDWVVEMFAPEGPKILRRDGYFYMILAVGGTSGPPTSHMVIVARSKSIHGPWIDCPRNPIVRTWAKSEPWWSKGHATVVEGPLGDWWMVYHGYENGYRTLGRATLLEPIRWTDDGWIEALGGDLSKPLRKPAPGVGASVSPGFSDDFSGPKVGLQWSFFNAGPDEGERLNISPRGLELAARGTDVADSPPLTLITGDRAYEVEVTMDASEGARGGLLVYYSEKAFSGFGFDGERLLTYNGGCLHSWIPGTAPQGPKTLRLRNDDQVLTLSYSTDGASWTQVPWQMEVSGFHHNAFGGFTCLKIGLFSAGKGAVTFSRFLYRGERLLWNQPGHVGS